MVKAAQFEKKELKKKSENLSAWYTDVVLKAELADYAPVKGTMVIRPYGYALWERVTEIFNAMIKRAGVANAYFPLFIPYSLLEKEKEHIAGFSPELAVVTIGGGEKLKDPLVVRPTSETIMYAMFARWIKSWRDLPLLLNQWSNVVRWEKRTYLFLRTTEFLWQEGHTAHASESDAIDFALKALEWYRTVYEEYFAMPVYSGIKSAAEQFAGAKTTYSIEALMPDGKALQGATSHNLGQNFSKVFDIQYQNKEGKRDSVWQTSWGLSTRSLGGLFLTHGDDNGLIIPPKIAPTQVVLIPIVSSNKVALDILTYCDELASMLTKGMYAKLPIRPHIDRRDWVSVGRKYNEWEVKGVPLRIEVGVEEYKGRKVSLVRRDTGKKSVVPLDRVVDECVSILDAIQKNLLTKAKKFLSDNTHDAATYEELQKIMNTTRGFIRSFWCEETQCEEQIKAETKATARCLPLETQEESGLCIVCGKPARHRWYFAQSY